MIALPETYTLHRGTDAHGVEYLLTVWSDGTHELATRTPAERTWSPPVSLTPEARGPLHTTGPTVRVPTQPGVGVA